MIKVESTKNDMADILVSVIVPVYNTERYLDGALDSLTKQTFHSYELILIDDGSTDKTAGICDRWAAKDSRIKVIHQNNQGVSAARMVGMKEAHGEYFISCDADDWMEPNYIAELYNTAKAENADIVFCDYDLVYANHRKVVVNKIENLDRTSYLKAQLAGGMWGTYWNKMIRLSLLKQHGIWPIAGLQMWEDYVVTNRCAMYADKFAYCPKVLYHYNQTNIGAMTKQKSLKNSLDIMTATEICIAELSKSGLIDSFTNDVTNMKIYAKSYLLAPPYCDLKKWFNTFNEVNNIVFQKESGTRRMAIRLSQKGFFHIADLLVYISWLIRRAGGKIKQIF